MSVASVIVIHGYRGVPDDIWKPWLKRELLARDIAVAMPAMASPNEPNEAAWVAQIAELVAQAETPIILVGHSLGALAIFRYLETVATTPVHGIVSIAGVIDPAAMDPKRYGFASSWTTPHHWEQIRAMARHIVALHSRDDSLVPIVHSELLVVKAQAELFDVDGYNHFSEGTTNPTELPELLHIIDTLVQLAK